MWIGRHFDTVDRSWQIGVADKPATLELGVTRVPQNSHIQVNNCWPIMQWRGEPVNSSNGEFVTRDRTRFLMKQLVAVNTPQWHSELVTVSKTTHAKWTCRSQWTPWHVKLRPHQQYSRSFYIIIIIIIINVKINVALSENASRTRYTIKTKAKEMSSGTEKFSVVLWKTGVSWQKWQRAEDCSTRARLQLRMPGRWWCVVWFAVQWAVDIVI